MQDEGGIDGFAAPPSSFEYNAVDEFLPYPVSVVMAWMKANQVNGMEHALTMLERKLSGRTLPTKDRTTKFSTTKQTRYDDDD